MDSDDWWLKVGKFPPGDIWVVTAHGKRARFPDPIAAVKHYMRLKGVTTKKLATALGVTTHTVRYYLAYGGKFDQYSFRRKLCIILDIPPVLLGLDEQSIQQEITDEVLGQRVYDHRNEQRWTQYQLGQALDPCLCEASIQHLEKGRGLDSMKRRRALSFLLSIPPALLGLAEPPATTTTPAPHIIVPKTTISLSGVLLECKSVQAQIIDSYHESVGKERIPEVAAQLRTLQRSLKVANRESQRLEIIDMQAVYHAFYTWVGIDESNYELALSHANKEVELAETLLDETDWRSRDRLAMARKHRSEVWRQCEDMEQAVQDIDAAMHYANGVSNLTICRIFSEAGIVHALAGEHGKGQAYGQTLLERAGKMLPIKEEDRYHGRFSRGFYYLRRAQVFQNEEAIKDARDADPGSMPRRTLILDIEEAKMHLQRGIYDEAARLAVQSLDKARSINSRQSIMRIRSLYDGLKDHMDIPEVARLSLFYLSR